MQAGYAVIFLNRRHSIQPFTKGLPSGEIMDTLTDVLDCNGGSTLRVNHDASNIVRQAVAKAKQVQEFQRQWLSARKSAPQQMLVYRFTEISIEEG